MNDMLGRTLAAGQTVIFGVSRRNTNFRVGLVTEIKNDGTTKVTSINTGHVNNILSENTTYTYQGQTYQRIHIYKNSWPSDRLLIVVDKDLDPVKEYLMEQT